MDTSTIATLAWGIGIPFAGTVLGAACVLFMRRELHGQVQRGLTGFAAGIMVAASIWSLLIPAIEQAETNMGVAAPAGNPTAPAILPVLAGFWAGVLFLLLLDHVVPHLHQGSDEPEGLPSGWGRTTKLVMAVTLHNIPEGMAVGVVYAGLLSQDSQVGAMGALALSIGIAVQNFPEGAIISLPLRAQGMKRSRAFWAGVLSGVVEPIGALATVAATSLVVPALPSLLAFAAGAMLYVVVEELIPEMSQGAHSNVGVMAFSLGFSLMMTLDVVLG